MAEGIDKAPSVRLLAYEKKHMKRFDASLDAVFRTGHVEAVHDLRVASRRLTEPLGIMEKWVGPRAVEKVRRLLKRSIRSMRELRDLDVVLGSLSALPPSGGLEGTDLAQLEGVLTRKRERRLDKARRACHRARPADAMEYLDAICESFGESASKDGDDEIVQRVERLYQGWVARTLEKDPRRPETKDLHETRLCVKRLRYSAELFRDVKQQENPALISALVQMQDLLGTWNDHLMASSLVSRIARKNRALVHQPGWSARLLEYAAYRARSAADKRQQILDAWPALENILRACDVSASRETAPDMKRKSLGTPA